MARMKYSALNGTSAKISCQVTAEAAKGERRESRRKRGCAIVSVSSRVLKDGLA